MTQSRVLPVLPLRDVVIHPGSTAPIAAGRPGSIRALEVAHRDHGGLVFAVAQRDSSSDGQPDDLFRVGTIAEVQQVQSGPGAVRLLLHGRTRATAIRFESADGHLMARVNELADVPPANPQDPTFVALHREVRERAAELGRKVGLPQEVIRQVLDGAAEPGQLADLVAAYLDAPHTERQALLEMTVVEDRLRRVLVLAAKQLQVLDAQQEIHSKVQEEIGEQQREMVLRRQLHAIQKELGEGNDNELEELRQRLDALELPKDARREVDREFARLQRLGREAMEGQVIRTFLETVAELPWNERSTEHIDLRRAIEVLDEDHYGLADVKNRVLEFLAVRQLEALRAADPDAADAEPASRRAPIMLFAGPPGVGKTSIAKAIARAMGREYVRVSLGGARDQADISGHRRTYVGAMPGRILQGMKQAGTRNPVFLLDEIDKLGVSFQGDPASALLEVLDPAQNDTFTDHYLGVPFDLGEVLFIATANFVQNIPGPLLDRMERIDFGGYTETEKLEIARRYLLPRQLRESAMRSEQLTVDDQAVTEVIRGHTREAGVRQLERELGKLARKAARRIAAREATTVAVSRGDVAKLLGRPRVHPEHALDGDTIGVATGMYYTPAGGDIMFVEASTMPGKGALILTGQLGEVMRESALAAWSYARAHAAALHVETATVDQDLHVHVPAGAIPKDGPSAGVAMATAIVSKLTGRPARGDVAMTGEITLSGRVLPIGGVKEKVLGGVRAGISKFVLPRANEADLDDLPTEVRGRIEVHLVDEVGEALALALRDATFDRGRLLFTGDDPDTVQPLSDRWRLVAS